MAWPVLKTRDKLYQSLFAFDRKPLKHFFLNCVSFSIWVSNYSEVTKGDRAEASMNWKIKKLLCIKEKRLRFSFYFIIGTFIIKCPEQESWTNTMQLLFSKWIRRFSAFYLREQGVIFLFEITYRHIISLVWTENTRLWAQASNLILFGIKIRRP